MVEYRWDAALYLLSMLEHSYIIFIGRVSRLPGHRRIIFYYLNSTEKRFLSMVMKNVQLPGAASYDTQIEIHTSTQNYDMIISRELKILLSDPSRKNGVIDKGKYRKLFSQQNCNEHKHHFQDRNYFTHTTIENHCVTTQFPEFPFCGPHVKPHGVQGLSKHWVFFKPKMGHELLVNHFKSFLFFLCKNN